MKKFRIVFFGTPDFSVPSLKVLNKREDIEVFKVVTMPDRRSGRGQKLTPPPVAVYAKENSLDLFQTENINKNLDLLDQLESAEIDFFVVIAFAQFLGKRLLDIPKIAPFNIHTSLLPRYRGAAPIQYAILNGDKTTGVCIQRMVKKMDAGDIAIQKEISLSNKITGGELFEVLKHEASTSLNDLIDKLQSDDIVYIPQNHEEASFAPTLKKKDGLLLFTQSTTDELLNQIRAFSPWPGTFSFLGGKRLKVLKAEKDVQDIEVGLLSLNYGTLSIGTLDGSIRLTQVQLEGKKPCSDLELINGLKNNANFKYEISEVMP